ncbi:MAG: phosphoribosyltransferase [Flavobacteriia bacterium]|nr:phosphoribosyltransferase [Flavobacteriia bacterium]OIP46562.1 MAG: phosphoribosyltransferase [Flavobacteriaceae bacterium CG2_30_31_66]PIV95433.1 MAG: phosphoribosyltransferase [Flavobacteriaceae bacterium CG17_big_fil_post_rev_8_21_14_2_50_31_13]PIX11181.1 MAG: phosphoribosyltransferase [Flavobacteriaceae bacterium CG_4_8_14_3_um_filter_31_8]PIY14086.1 MAG: phosphoribosyltransferase [Flavobacteriaceae bacterium CG_4_10_14_3_um_filter_31_253]PIZ09402.1 MAG: phosphoribosyltransferase [Flavo
MTKENNIILDTIQINQKIKRIAYQIYESNSDEKEVVIAGIMGNGYIFAEKLVKVLSEISDLKVIICLVNINKKNPLDIVTTSLTVNEYKNKSLVLVDDVLSSGTTLIYGVKHFLDVPLKRFKTAVLVNRNHKKYPVKADFKGVSLSTSIKEHVQIDFLEEKSVAYLQ